MKMHTNSDKDGVKRGGLSPHGHIVLFEIALEMKKAGFPEFFIEDTVRVALDFEGVADLMKLWRDEEDSEERNEIIADIQDMLNACLQKEKIENSKGNSSASVNII